MAKAEDVPGVELVRLDRSRRSEAARVLAEALADNPTQVQVHGPERVRRVRDLEALAAAVLRSRGEPAFVALKGGEIIGVASVARPGECTPSLRRQLANLPLIVRLGVRTATALSEHGSAWSRHDPRNPHWHVGPVGVVPAMQGQGVGTCLMTALSRFLDAQAGTAYLETDREENVRFYRRAGYHMIREEALVGLPHWFMRRYPRP